MRAVSVASDLFDISIHFISFLIISLIFLLFLLPDTFNFLHVVDKKPCALPLRTLAPWPRTILPQDATSGSEAPRLGLQATARVDVHLWRLPHVACGSLEGFFSLNDRGSPDAMDDLLVLLRALAWIQDVNAGPRVPGVHLTVGRAPSRLTLSPSLFLF